MISWITTPRSRSSSLGVQPGAPDEVAEQVDRLRSALGANGDVEGHQVVAGVGVEHAPQPLGGLVDVLVGGVLLAPLEHEVLEEVGHAVLLGALVAGPGVEGQEHRQRARARQLEAVQRHPVLGDGARAQARHSPATLEHPGVAPPGGEGRQPLDYAGDASQMNAPAHLPERNPRRARWLAGVLVAIAVLAARHLAGRAP